jgi:Spy/CpxP family protein refolding chaperone
MSSPVFKPWLVLALIFLAGVGTGVLLTIGLGPHFRHPPGVQMMRRHWMEHLTQKLNLSADQQTKIEPIISSATDQLQGLHHEEMDKASQIMASVNTQISALLTPEQKAQMQQMETERQKDFSGHMHRWMHGDGGGPGMPPGP